LENLDEYRDESGDLWVGDEDSDVVFAHYPADRENNGHFTIYWPSEISEAAVRNFMMAYIRQCDTDGTIRVRVYGENCNSDFWFALRQFEYIWDSDRDVIPPEAQIVRFEHHANEHNESNSEDDIASDVLFIVWFPTSLAGIGEEQRRDVTTGVYGALGTFEALHENLVDCIAGSTEHLSGRSQIYEITEELLRIARR